MSSQGQLYIKGSGRDLQFSGDGGGGGGLVAKSCLTLETLQAPTSMGFPRQEYWSGLPFHFPGDLPDSGTLNCSFVSAQSTLSPITPAEANFSFKSHFLSFSSSSFSLNPCGLSAPLFIPHTSPYTLCHTLCHTLYSDECNAWVCVMLEFLTRFTSPQEGSDWKSSGEVSWAIHFIHPSFCQQPWRERDIWLIF